MKKTKEIIGLPVIDLSSGNEIGKVWDIILNGDKGVADFFIIDDGMMILGAKVVAAKDIQGIGEYALTLGKKETLRDIAKVDHAIQLFKKNIKVKGTKVLTQKGRLVGEIGDIYIDENDCSIAALEFMFFDNFQEIKVIPRNGVLTFGENLIVAVENIEEILDDVPLSEEQQGKKKKALNTENTLNNSEFKGLQSQPKDEQSNMSYVEAVQPEMSVDMEIQKFVEGKADASITSENTQEETIDEILDIEEAEVVDNISQDYFAEQNDNQESIENELENDQIEQVFQDKSKELVEENKQQPEIQGNAEQSDVEIFEEGIKTTAYTYKPAHPQKTENRQKQNEKQGENRSSDLFEQKQKEFLIGRKVTKAIKDKHEKNILNEGDVITEEALNKAKDVGKLIEIVMNNKV